MAQDDINLAEEYNEYLDKTFSSQRRNKHPMPLAAQIVQGRLSLPSIIDLINKTPSLVNDRDKDGRVPLMVYWHSSLYDILLSHGADPNACDNHGNTILMYQRKNSYGFTALLEAGANINAKNKKGVALITMALEEGLRIQPLLNAGAVWQPVPSEIKDTAFLNCLYNENIPILEKVIEDGLPSEKVYLYAKVWSGCHDQKKFDWLKPLGKHYSRQTRNNLTKREENLLMDELKRRQYDADPKLFKALLANMRDCLDDASTLNTYLARCGVGGEASDEILELVLNAGADPNGGRNWKDNTDIPTALYWAVSSRRTRAVKMLLEHGADPTTGTSYMDSDDTCVACAICNNDLDILQMLIDAKADLNFAIRCNRTPILTAIREDNLPALKMVIEGGADPNLADPYGRIPIGWLDRKRNSPELCAYFEAIVNKSDAP